MEFEELSLFELFVTFVSESDLFDEVEVKFDKNIIIV